MESNDRGKLLTIGIPNYNYEKYIAQTINSVLCQKGDDIEILIADNLSTDKSWEIISSIKDSRVKIFQHNSNIGFYANWNFLLNNATGKYFLLLPSDDFLSENFYTSFKTIYEQCGQENTETIIWGYGNLYEESNIIKYASPDIPNAYQLNSVTNLKISVRHFSPPWAHAQLTKTLIAAGGYKNGSRRLDTLLFYDAICMKPDQTVLYIKETLAYQRMHENNERHIRDSEIIYDNIHLAIKILTIEQNYFVRIRLRFFLIKNVLIALISLRDIKKVNKLVYSNFGFLDIIKLFVCSPFVLVLFVSGRLIRVWPFTKLNKYLSI